MAGAAERRMVASGHRGRLRTRRRRWPRRRGADPVGTVRLLGDPIRLVPGLPARAVVPLDAPGADPGVLPDPLVDAPAVDAGRRNGGQLRTGSAAGEVDR